MNDFVREEAAGEARAVDVVVTGAGQAGLSAAFHLRRTGLEPDRDFVVLDHAPRPGGAWQFRWPSLTYGKVHGMHALPGMELTGADPARPSSEVIGGYFDAYERTFGLRVHRPVDVTAVREGEGGRLWVETSEGSYATRALINATGTWDRPFWPRYPGQETFRGRQLHTAGYPGPEEFAGRRVLVVGGGASGTQHLMEIAEVAADTFWVTRREPVFREGPFGEAEGRAAVALVEERVRRGLPPQSVVSVTGLPLNDAIRAARARGPGPAPDVRPDHPDRGGLERRPERRRGRDPVGDRLPGGDRPPDPAAAAGAGRRHPGGGTRAVRDERVHLVGYGPRPRRSAPTGPDARRSPTSAGSCAARRNARRAGSRTGSRTGPPFPRADPPPRGDPPRRTAPFPPPQDFPALLLALNSATFARWEA